MWAAFAGAVLAGAVDEAVGVVDEVVGVVVDLAGVDEVVGAVSLAGVGEAVGAVSLAGVVYLAGAAYLAGVGAGVGLVDVGVSLAGVGEAAGVEGEDAAGVVAATGGDPEETLELDSVGAPACLGTSMKNHTTAKIAPKSSSMPSMMRKIASGLF
jgi:hypothetical protein